MKYIILSLFVFAGLAYSQVSERKALIIGVSEYSNPEIEKLRGVPHDMLSATKIAVAMGIPEKNIKYIKNSEATKANIMAALKEAGDSTTEGTRAFVYYSGHGTRYPDPKTGECIDGLLTFDAQAITNAEFAKASKKLTQSSDKVITMIDACFSEGVVGSKSKTRSLDLAQFSPKFQSKSNAEACKPVNVITRGLLPEVTRLGGLQENFVQITSSRPDEVSYDDANAGGVATQSMRDCLLGKAVDLNGSGAITMGEVEICAQKSVDKMLKSSNVTQHITVSGSRNLIPVAFKEPPKPEQTLAQITPPSVATAPAVLVAPPSLTSLAESSPVATPVVPTKPIENAKPPMQQVPPVRPPAPVIEPTLASLATLKDIEQQRNPRRSIEVKVNKPILKIGKDLLDLSIKS
ncbi:MAG: caspase family protein, partial [Burkholderiaceae bacterium]